MQHRSLQFAATFVALGSVCAVPRVGRAADPPSAAASSDGDAASRAARAPLPKLAPISAPEATVEAVRDLQRIVDLLTSSDRKTRESGLQAITEASPPMVGAVRQRVQEIRTALDREAAPKLLDDIRRAGRKSLKSKGDDSGKDNATTKKGKGEGKKSSTSADEDGDWLEFLVDNPRLKDKTWRHLVELVAMNRVLTTVGTTPAVRELIAMHTYFGDLLRVDVQRQIAKLRDKAVPALIEARQHDAKMIQRWASRQLDILGKAIPGEAVSTNDTQVIADVLRAYGRTRDVDAVRVMLSFSNSERLELREAAREAIGAMGEPATWQLREAYLSMTGDKAPRDWSWDRVARELFTSFDRARLAEVYKTMDEGAALAKKGEHKAAIEHFDRVLARAPLFERRAEMAASYLAAARDLEKSDSKSALELYRKALRLDPHADESRKIEAAVAFLEAVELEREGRPDKFLFERALELDPTHAGARDALAHLGEVATERKARARSYAAAGTISVLALAAMLFLWRGRRKEPLRERHPISTVPAVGDPPVATGDAPAGSESASDPGPPAPPSAEP